FLPDHWGAARVSAVVDLHAAQPGTRAWAHGSLAELYLVLLAYGEQTCLTTHCAAHKQACQHAQDLMTIAELDSPPISSTHRQFKRHAEWWGDKDFEDTLASIGPPRKRSWLQQEPNLGLTHVAQELVTILAKGLKNSP